MMAHGPMRALGAIVAAIATGAPRAKSCAMNPSSITRMTKTESRADALLDLAQRQRRFEWELARDQQTRAAARFVSGRTHAMLNLVQVVRLASQQLEQMCGEAGKEF